MNSSTHKRIADLLLSAMYQRGVYGITSSFMYGRPGAPQWQQNLGATVSFRYADLVRAALYLRQNGPTYLRYLAMDDIESMLVKFVSDNYWHISDAAFGHQFDDDYSAHVSVEAKMAFADAIGMSELFQASSELTLFPLVPVRVEADFDSDSFFLIRATSLDQARLPPGFESENIVPGQFPPLRGWEWKKQTPAAWLGVRSPAIQASRKMKSAILGALALTQSAQYRYRFSLREVFGGRCTLGRGAATSFSASHTPPMAHDIVVTEHDHAWLSVVSGKLGNREKATRRELRALEYLYRAWPMSPPERFPILCMALDAMFGDVAHAAQAVIDKVRDVLGDHVSDERLRLLLDIRAAVIHGGAPDLYDSRKYARYYSRYEVDPIRDMELVVGESVRARAFNGKLIEHAAPDAELLAQLRAQGRLAPSSVDRTILSRNS
jgi:hypothetical protein